MAGTPKPYVTMERLDNNDVMLRIANEHAIRTIEELVNQGIHHASNGIYNELREVEGTPCSVDYTNMALHQLMLYGELNLDKWSRAVVARTSNEIYLVAFRRLCHLLRIKR